MLAVKAVLTYHGSVPGARRTGAGDAHAEAADAAFSVLCRQVEAVRTTLAAILAHDVTLTQALARGWVA